MVRVAVRYNNDFNLTLKKKKQRVNINYCDFFMTCVHAQT